METAPLAVALTVAPPLMATPSSCCPEPPSLPLRDTPPAAAVVVVARAVAAGRGDRGPALAGRLHRGAVEEDANVAGGGSATAAGDAQGAVDRAHCAAIGCEHRAADADVDADVVVLRAGG